MGLTLTYIADVQAEFKHVTWPTKSEAVHLTLVVVGGSLLVGLFVGGVDVVLVKLLGFLLLK
jgi:preprotein translocase SecE subunit